VADLDRKTCIVTYLPPFGKENENCGKTDSFKYVICNKLGCDTAFIRVWLKCDGLQIYNAVSPNKDGINDVFYITNITEYPKSELCIYNRWGNQVYRVTGYKNDWSATWDGKELPDGTYFYILDLKDGKTKPKQGFIEIFR
jgi:gliding motility-associated-like protein